MTFKTISNYLSLVKFSHTIFALPFAFVGFFLGYKEIVPLQNATKSVGVLFILVVLCMVFARSAAMAFNRYIDAQYDAMNPRTASREIPAGVIEKQKAMMFIIINCVLFISCAFFINKMCFYLSPIALFVILFYSYTKRFTAMCHFVLGVGLSLAPIGAYLAITNEFSLLPILFSIVVLTWVSGFDILYSLQDEDFDKTNELHSIPAWLGRTGAILFSIGLHIITAIIVIAIGILGSFHFTYWIGAILFIGLLIYQHILVKPTDISKVNMAFATTNGVASIVFASCTIIAIFLNK